MNHPAARSTIGGLIRVWLAAALVAGSGVGGAIDAGRALAPVLLRAAGAGALLAAAGVEVANAQVTTIPVTPTPTPTPRRATVTQATTTASPTATPRRSPAAPIRWTIVPKGGQSVRAGERRASLSPAGQPHDRLFPPRTRPSTPRPAVTPRPTRPTPTRPAARTAATSGDAVRLAATAALRSAQTTGDVVAWGYNGEGELGDGTAAGPDACGGYGYVCSFAPVDVSGLTGVVQLAAGSGHTLALTDDGTVWAWGWNDRSQLGTPAIDNENCGGAACRTAPAHLSGLTNVVQIAAGAEHSLALKSDGTVWAWGQNDTGQVGNGQTSDVATPTQVLTGVTAIGAGLWHSLAVQTDGSVWAWGDDGWGQVGQPPDQADTCQSVYPCVKTATQVADVGGIVAVAGAVGHTLALGGDGRVWAWGSGEWGELGDGVHAARSTPDLVPSLTGVTAIAAGEDHSVALKGDGTVWTWGWGDYGQLGLAISGNDSCTGGYTCRSAPTQVTGLSAVSAIDAWNYTQARKTDGTLWSWGLDDVGQVGATASGSCGLPCVETPVQSHSGTLSGVGVLAPGISHAVASTVGSTSSASGLPVETIPAGSAFNGPYVNGAASGGVSTFTGSFGANPSGGTAAAAAGLGPVPQLSLAYNSNDTRVGPLGPSWTHSYAQHLSDAGDTTGDVVLTGPQGRADRYVHNTDGSYSPPAGVYTTLVRNGNGTFTATDKNLATRTFDATGRLSRVADRYGNASVLSYDASGRLASVSDPGGRGLLRLSYNATSGRLTSVTDWAGRSTGYAYDGSGRLNQVTDRAGHATSYAYDGTSTRITTVTDARSIAVLTQTFDGQGRVATQKDARGLSTGQQTSFSYVDNGNGTKTTTVTHPSSAFDAFAPQTIDTYDSHGWLTQRIVKPSSTETYTTTYGYDAAGNLTSTTNARGNTTTFCYDVGVSGSAISGSRGNLTRRIAPAPPGGNPLVTLYAYDAKNNLTQTVSPAGVANGSSVGCATNLSSTVDTMRTTDLAFDATGVFLLSATSRYTDHASTAQTAVTKFEYGDTANPGRVTRIIPPRGNTTSTPDNTYSTTVTYYGSGAQRGLPHTVTDPDGVAWTSAYDAAGRRTDAYDASSNHFAFAYDAEDRLTSYQTPNGSTGAIAGTLHYDAVGNRDYAIDPNGHYTRYAYDERGALAEVRQSTTTTDPDNDAAKIVTKYAYDHLGHLARVTRAEGLGAERATDYVADGLGRLRSEIQYPSWSSTSGSLTTQYTYDANSNRATVVDALSRTTTFGYDALDRLISIDYSAAGTSDVAYTYDANGTRHTMVTGSDTTTYAYDEQNRLTSVTFPGSKTVGYRYDRDGHRSRITYPDGTWVDYSFDKAGRLSGTSDSARDEFGNPIPVTTAYEYWADGSLKKITNANGTTTSFAYDAAHRLTQVVSKDGTTVLDQHDYTLDAVGNRTRLQEVLAPAGGGAPTSVDTTYGYDYLNRLTSATTSGATTVYGYDAVGNRTSAGPSGSPTTYTYDKADRITAAGSTSYTVDANGNLTGRGASNTLTYDQANRLTSIAFGSSNSGAYAYDGDGNRVGRSFATASTTGNVAYVLDVNRGLPTVIDDDARKYVYTLGLAYSVDKTTGAVLTYHADGLGSVRALTDASKAVVQTYRTDAWGTVLATAGSSTQPFSFTGEPTDIESGFVYLRARFYDPAIGRFLSRDPFFGSASSPPSLNRYSYVRNNPTDLIDPSGFEDCDSVGDCQPIGGAVLFSPGLPPQTDGRQPRASRQGDGPAGPPAGPGTTSLRAGAPNVGAEGAEAGQNAAPRGGVYVLRDPATGDVVRTGRAKNLADRERDHRRLGYEFEDVYRTDNYGEQRGLEQYLYDLYPGAVLNKIRAIAEKNTRIADYLNAAADYLAGLP